MVIFSGDIGLKIDKMSTYEYYYNQDQVHSNIKACPRTPSVNKKPKSKVHAGKPNSIFYEFS